MRSFALVFVSIAGCAVAPAPQPGAIEVALVAPSGAGSFYRLPAGTSLNLAGTNGFSGSFGLDGDDVAVSFDVPTGTYTPTLVHPQGYTSTWPLERTNADGTSETVDAQLILPSSVGVAEDQTTNLVIWFNVATSQTIVFAHGSIDTSLVVDEMTASAYRISVELAQPDLNDATFDHAAPAELQSLLPSPPASVGQIRVDVHTLGDWQWTAPGQACASAAIDAISAPSGGYGDLLAETAGGQARVCISGDGVNSVGSMSLELDRAGAARTSTFAGLADGYAFGAQLSVAFATDRPLFDGDNLDLPAIPASAPSGGFVSASLWSTDRWYVGTASGSGTMRFAGM